MVLLSTDSTGKFDDKFWKYFRKQRLEIPTDKTLAHDLLNIRRPEKYYSKMIFKLSWIILSNQSNNGHVEWNNGRWPVKSDGNEHGNEYVFNITIQTLLILVDYGF